MKWPWDNPPPEERNYTDAALTTLLANAHAGGQATQPQATAGIEIAAALWSRAFGSATVDGTSISAENLACIGRDLIVSGETVWVRIGDDLHRAHTWEALAGSGGIGAQWRYRVHIPHPGEKNHTAVLPSEQVAHIRYSTDPAKPWQGVPPWQRMAQTARMAAELEIALTHEAAAPRGSIVPVPWNARFSQGKSSSRINVTGILSSLDGGVITVGSERAEGFNLPEWKTIRLGASPPQTMLSLLDQATKDLLAACGVPIDLVTAGGTGQREAWRRFLHGTVQPIARICEYELGKLYGKDITLSFDALFASDLAGRARAFGSMVKGGMALDKAAALSGLMSDDE